MKLRASDHAGPAARLDFREYREKYGKPGDDTEAFQKAFEDIGKYSLRDFYLPEGTYYLTETVDISALSNGEFHGNGYPEIVMKDPSKDIFSHRCAWKLTVDGISFNGGKSHLLLKNNNVDRTNIFITNCKFQESSGFAILLERDLRSAHILIDRCSFNGNRQVLQNASDWARLSNSWISTSPEMFDQAVIVNYGCLTLDHVLGVPLVKGPKEVTRQRWIDNHGLKLTCRDTRFGGEGGGLPIVWNFRKYRESYPLVRSSILLSDCWLYCAGQEAIRCFEIPNKIRIEYCTGVLDAAFFSLEKNADLASLRDKPERITQLISLETSQSEATRVSEMPELLRNVVRSDAVKFIEAPSVQTNEKGKQ